MQKRNEKTNQMKPMEKEMRKILILSLLVVLFAGGAEARQSYWKYYLPIDEMTHHLNFEVHH